MELIPRRVCLVDARLDIWRDVYITSHHPVTMSALDDLFSANSPTPPSPGIPSPSGTPGPSRRRGGEALFLDGASTPSQTPVKRRYADFADDEEPPLSPIGGEYLERRRNNYGHLHVDISAAEAENVGEGGGDDAVDVSTVAPRAIAELFDDPLAVQDPLALGGTAEEEPKPRRVMAKVDAERLLGPKGLPALMVAARKFKSKGKGHEVSPDCDGAVCRLSADHTPQLSPRSPLTPRHLISVG